MLVDGRFWAGVLVGVLALDVGFRDCAIRDGVTEPPQVPHPVIPGSSEIGVGVLGGQHPAGDLVVSSRLNNRVQTYSGTSGAFLHDLTIGLANPAYLVTTP